MRYLGVIGEPGKRSLSPAFQQAAIDALGLDLVYEAWPTPRDGLETRITGLRSADVLGANVTIPHKEAVIPLLDELEPLARRVGAVNTIRNASGRLSGHNTDVAGFLRALKEDGGFEPGGCRAVIAGAGGAARAVFVALCDAGAASVTVIARTTGRAEALVRALGPSGGVAIEILPEGPASWPQATDGADLLVNCTPLGTAGSSVEALSPIPAEAIQSPMLVYDLVYRPSETPLLTAAAARGARVLGGLPMLIYQGAASFEIWTGREAPVDVMFAAARAALAREGDDPC